LTQKNRTPSAAGTFSCLGAFGRRASEVSTPVRPTHSRRTMLAVFEQIFRQSVCCSSRGVSAVRRVLFGAGAAGSDKDVRCLDGDFGRDCKKTHVHIEYLSTGEDADRFDEAFRQSNLVGFVSLLASNQPVHRLLDPLHPWAEAPKTIGTLAAMQLALLASDVANEDPEIRDSVREAGAVPPLVDFLRSDDDDRVQTAVVALNYLTCENTANAVAAYDAGAMPMLMKHCSSVVPGQCWAAASALCNMYMWNEEYRKEFVTLGGVYALLRQLDASLDLGEEHAEKHAEVMLAALTNLEYFIMDVQEHIVYNEYCVLVAEHGALAKVEILLEADDEEVRKTAEQMLDMLNAATRSSPT